MENIQRLEGLNPNTTIIIIAAPNGGGKGSIIKELLNTQLGLSIAKCPRVTTRRQTSADIVGQDYFFISKDDFKSKVERHELLEHMTWPIGSYGTDIQTLISVGNMNDLVILDLDVDPAIEIKQYLQEQGINCIDIMLIPVDKDQLEADSSFSEALRILGRRQMHRNRGESATTHEINGRLQQAALMLAKHSQFSHVVSNKDGKFEEAFRQVLQIILQEKKNRTL